MALHQLMVRVEKALDQQERTLGVFLDIEGVFNNTCYDSMCDALVKHGCHNTNVWWIRATLEDRMVVAILTISSMRLQQPGGANRGVCCHHFCGVLLWMI
jgi:cell division FtsZ-interacting protein ZapD